MTDIAIVGCAGFLGSNVSNYLVQHTKYQVCGIDNLSTTPDMYNLQFAFNSRARFEFYLSNAHDAQIIGKFFEIEKPKTIIYNILTAQLDLIEHGRDWGPFLETLRMWLDLSYLHGSTKFILMSGSCSDLSELQSIFLKKCYDMAMSYEHKFKVIILDYGDVYGPRQRTRTGVAKLIVDAIQGSEQATGPTSEDRIYVKDMFNNVMYFIDDADESGAYSIHGDVRLSDESLKNIIKDVIAGSTPEVSPLSLEPKAPPYPSNNFNWRPKYELLSAIEHTIVWYDSNRWAWR